MCLPAILSFLYSVRAGPILVRQATPYELIRVASAPLHSALDLGNHAAYLLWDRRYQSMQATSNLLCRTKSVHACTTHTLSPIKLSCLRAHRLAFSS